MVTFCAIRHQLNRHAIEPDVGAALRQRDRDLPLRIVQAADVANRHVIGSGAGGLEYVELSQGGVTWHLSGPGRVPIHFFPSRRSVRKRAR